MVLALGARPQGGGTGLFLAGAGAGVLGQTDGGGGGLTAKKHEQVISGMFPEISRTEGGGLRGYTDHQDAHCISSPHGRQSRRNP